MTYGSCTLYCSWLCWYLHIPLLIFVCYIQSMKQTWVFVSETNKARSKSKTLVFIPIVLLRTVICLEDFSCLSYLHRLMSPLIVELVKWIESGGACNKHWEPSKEEQADFEAHLAKMQMKKKHKPAALNNEFNKL